MGKFTFLVIRALVLFSFKITVAGSFLANDDESRQYSDYGQPCQGAGLDGGGCISKDIKNPLQCGSLGRCECAPGQYFCPTQNRCVSPPGGVCTTSARDGMPIRTCTDFATCWPNDRHNPDHSRQNGTCYCEPDAKEDPQTGLCKLRYGSTRCTKLNDCDVNSLVSCKYRRCKCHDQKYGTYNSTSLRCESLVGGCCGIQSNPPFPAAVCHEPNMKCVEGKCVCEDGYGQTGNKRCVKITPKTHVCQEESFSYPGPLPAYSLASFKTVQRDEVGEKSDEGNGNAAAVALTMESVGVLDSPNNVPAPPTESVPP